MFGTPRFFLYYKGKFRPRVFIASLINFGIVMILFYYVGLAWAFAFISLSTIFSYFPQLFIASTQFLVDPEFGEKDYIEYAGPPSKVRIIKSIFFSLIYILFTAYLFINYNFAMKEIN